MDTAKVSGIALSYWIICFLVFLDARHNFSGQVLCRRHVVSDSG